MILVILIYIAINPMYRVPRWCYKAYKDPNNSFHDEYDGITISCQVGFLSDYPVSGTGYLRTEYTGLLDILC